MLLYLHIKGKVTKACYGKSACLGEKYLVQVMKVFVKHFHSRHSGERENKHCPVALHSNPPWQYLIACLVTSPPYSEDVFFSSVPGDAGVKVSGFMWDAVWWIWGSIIKQEACDGTRDVWRRCTAFTPASCGTHVESSPCDNKCYSTQSYSNATIFPLNIQLHSKPQITAVKSSVTSC